MKKYYLVDSEEELFEGDVVEVEFEKNVGKSRKIKRTEEFEITEDSIPHLLEMGIIYEEDDDLVGFDNSSCQPLAELTDKVEKLEDEVIKLNNLYRELEGSLLVKTANKPKK